MDDKSEKAFIKLFNNKVTKKTVINVAHKIEIIKNCNKVLLLENGEVLE